MTIIIARLLLYTLNKDILMRQQDVCSLMELEIELAEELEFANRINSAYVNIPVARVIHFMELLEEVLGDG